MPVRPDPRLRYEPPAIRKIKLVEGELAVTGCKSNAAMSGMSVPSCVRSGCKARGT